MSLEVYLETIMTKVWDLTFKGYGSLSDGVIYILATSIISTSHASYPKNQSEDGEQHTYFTFWSFPENFEIVFTLIY